MKNIAGKIYLLCAFSLAGTSVVTGYILSEKLSRFTITAVSLGIMILCLSPFYGLKTVQTMRKLNKSNWKLLALIVSGIAFALSIIPALTEHPFMAIRTIGSSDWLALIWYGLVVTALAFVFFFAGVKRCDAYTTAAFSGMIPLTSMLLSILLLRESIGLSQYAGGFLIVSSMLIIGYRRQKTLLSVDI